MARQIVIRTTKYRCFDCGQMVDLPAKYMNRSCTITPANLRRLLTAYALYLGIKQPIRLRVVASESFWMAISARNKSAVVCVYVDRAVFWLSLRQIHNKVAHEMSEFVHRGEAMQDRVESMHDKNARLIVKAAQDSAAIPKDLCIKRRC